MYRWPIVFAVVVGLAVPGVSISSAQTAPAAPSVKAFTPFKVMIGCRQYVERGEAAFLKQLEEERQTRE